MKIVKTPLRIEFLGGSTDIASFYSEYPGRVLNLAINKYVYVITKKTRNNELSLRYPGWEKSFKSAVDVDHLLTKKCLDYFKNPNGLEIISTSDIYLNGSGLGSSSSFTVSLANALSTKKLIPRDLAELACHIEIDLAGSPIGKQDQYAAAYGGLSYLYFRKDGFVVRKNLSEDKTLIKKLKDYLLIINTGKSRSTSKILEKQSRKGSKNFAILKRMSDIVMPGIEALKKGDMKTFAEILHEEWSIKKGLTEGISNISIERLYKTAINSGAYGGRLSGAGGGGFLVLIVDPRHRENVIKTLGSEKVLDVVFENSGSRIIYDDN